MKFVELKKSLENLKPVYLISGNDRFLCYNALEQISNACNLSMSEMNRVELFSCSADDIVTSANIYPFIDQKRLVVVRDFGPKANASKELQTISAYLDNPMPTTVLVFLNLDDDSFFKTIKSKLTYVDCNKLDQNAVANYIGKIFAKNNIICDANAVNLMALYCNYNMQRITGEIEKLICYFGEKGGKLDTQTVEDMVVQEKEYQIYSLAEYIARNDKQRAVDLVDSMIAKSGFGMLGHLYNNYRRALYIAVSKKTDDVLAKELGIKEFAVKMMRNQIAVFSPRKLKQIVDKLAILDADIKQGYIKEEVGIKKVVLEIIKIRNEK